MEEVKIIAKNSENNVLLQAHKELVNHILVYLKPMYLKCAVDLGIPDAIHNHGGPIALPDLLAALSLPPSRSPHLRRLMRMLTHSGLFATQNSLKILRDKNSLSLLPLVSMAFHSHLFDPSLSMSSWFRSGERTAFETVNGRKFWDVVASDGEMNRVFNDSMASNSRFLMEVVVKDQGEVFRGLTSLVDVGGGTGATARAITEAFGIRCTVLELPHVVGDTAVDGGVEFVAGSMFDRVPPADAVLLKLILHDWEDEECVKILRRCKEAIPPREEGGKVIIIDMVVGSGSEMKKPDEAELLSDALMMVLYGSLERDEKEWRKIFMEAGFSDYKIMPVLGVRSIIELYP